MPFTVLDLIMSSTGISYTVRNLILHQARSLLHGCTCTQVQVSIPLLALKYMWQVLWLAGKTCKCCVRLHIECGLDAYGCRPLVHATVLQSAHSSTRFRIHSCTHSLELLWKLAACVRIHVCVLVYDQLLLEMLHYKPWHHAVMC